MKALILAGGRGTRLRPFTHSMAKQLLPVANRPVLHFVVDQITRAGINEIVVIISPETGDQIQESLSENPWDVKFEFVLQDQPLGLAHAVKVGRTALGNSPFVMYLGDILFGGDIAKMVDDFQNSDSDASVLLRKVEDPTQYGVAVVDNNGKITRLVEKSKEFVSDLAIAGVYCFNPAIHDAIDRIKPAERGELEITDAIQNLLDHDKTVDAYPTTDWWFDCGSKRDLLTANSLALRDFTDQEISGIVSDDSEVSGTVFIAEGAQVKNSKLTGPLTISKGTIVENSSIGPSVSIGDNSTVRASMLKNSIVLNNAEIDGIQDLQNSIVGNNARVTNRNSDPTEISISDGSELSI
jgi:glucose-1-phosphate thymidylyltransferase